MASPRATPSDDRPLSLVTGACGFMGSHMVEVLAEAGHRVRATDLPAALRQDDRRRGCFPSVVRASGAEVVPLDLTSGEGLRPLVEGADFVFHVAAIFSYSAPWERLHAVNVEATERLLEAVDVHGKRGLRRLVLWGAGGVYGYPRDGEPIRETDPPDPPNDYLRSKHLQEQAVMRAGRERKIPFTIIRPTGVYGPRQVYGPADFMFRAARLPALALPRNLTENIPFVHARDVCRAALHLAQLDEAAGEAYNVSGERDLSTVAFARFLADLLDKPFLALPPVPAGAVRAGLVATARAIEPVFRRVGRRPPVERDMAAYFGRSFRFAVDKLKATGFEWQYADARNGLRATLDWYAREGWIPRAPRGAGRYRYETLARAPTDELERVLRAGVRPASQALAGWEFRGYNTLPVTALGGFRKFKKGFYADDRGLAGYNVAIRGSPLDARWEPRTRNGVVVHHGFYRVREPRSDTRDSLYADRAWLLDYGAGANPAYDPSRLLRDYLVQPYEDDPDLLLGKAYLALGPARKFVSYFVLGRDARATYP